MVRPKTKPQKRRPKFVSVQSHTLDSIIDEALAILDSKGKNKNMAGIVVPMQGVAVGFEPVPDGDYKGKFTGFKNGVTANNGDPKIDFEFTIEEPSEYAGKKLFMTQSVIVSGDKANIHFLKEVMVLLGADPADLETSIDTDEVLKELRGNDAAMKVGHREYQNKVYNTVKLVDADSWS